MIVLDTTVLVHAVGADHRLRSHASSELLSPLLIVEETDLREGLLAAEAAPATR